MTGIGNDLVLTNQRPALASMLDLCLRRPFSDSSQKNLTNADY
jgi:hypothetical protein